MTWGWSPKNEALKTGGALGTPAEAKQTGAWPNYEAEYLKARLQGSKTGRFNTTYPTVTNGARVTEELGDAEKHVYLDNVSKNYREEAESCLKEEFGDWLQGKHFTNISNETYENGPGKPMRRNVYSGVVGQPMPDNTWRPTYWGTDQLTHLPGVRDYLREIAMHKDKAEMEMNLLAEHGPQNIEEAWMYFKHWVKGRPVGPEECISNTYHVRSNRSDFGPQLPANLSSGPPYKPGFESMFPSMSTGTPPDAGTTSEGAGPSGTSGGAGPSGTSGGAGPSETSGAGNRGKSATRAREALDEASRLDKIEESKELRKNSHSERGKETRARARRTGGTDDTNMGEAPPGQDPAPADAPRKNWNPINEQRFATGYGEGQSEEYQTTQGSTTGRGSSQDPYNQNAEVEDEANERGAPKGRA